LTHLTKSATNFLVGDFKPIEIALSLVVLTSFSHSGSRPLLLHVIIRLILVSLVIFVLHSALLGIAQFPIPLRLQLPTRELGSVHCVIVNASASRVRKSCPLASLFLVSFLTSVIQVEPNPIIMVETVVATGADVEKRVKQPTEQK
jgi:hypothetical protein